MGPHQILVVLDVAVVSDTEVLRLLPDRRRDRTLLRLSEVSHRKPDPPGGMKGPYDWGLLGSAVEKLAEKARNEFHAAGGDAVLYLAGRAPLPLFVQLGYALNKFIGDTRVLDDTRVLNPYRGGPWVEYSVEARASGEEPRFFDRVTGLPDDEVEANGVVSVYISTIGAPAPREAFRDALDKIGHASAGIVEIRTTAAGDVTPEAIGRLVTQLNAELPRITGTYPHAAGLALFVAGPVPLAFAAGRALNLHAQRDIWVMNYDRDRPGEPRYEVAVALPFRAKARIVSDADGDRLARRAALDAMIEGVEELRQTLKKEDFPPGVTRMSRRYLSFLNDLRCHRDPEGDAFALHIAERKLSVGRGLLEAVRGADRAMLGRFAQLLVLHELYHDDQDLRSSNYAEIGRAGVVLEEVDFWADAFALETLIAWDLRQGGPRAQRRAAEIATGWIDTAVFGIEAFDRFEHGDPVERLYERRLRRYLIWHLQHQRAARVRGRDDVHQLFEDRLVVELAPLDGALDARGDKLVKQAHVGRTELFAVLRGHLVRRGPRPGFQPADLVGAVQAFRREQIRQIMDVLVEDHRSVLAPWTET